MLFELFLTALELLKIALNEVIEIPILSALYGGITQGHDLTAISLCSLVIAIPTTVMSKLITGESAFQGITVTGQSDDPLDIKKKKRSWAIAYGCFHTFLTLSDLVYDIQGGASKETSPEGRQVELGKKYKFNQRGRVLKKYTNNIKRETATPAVRKQAFDIDSASNLGKGMTVFKLVTIGVGVMAQVAGNPLGHIEKLTHSELESLRQAGYNTPDYWGYIVWNFQWTYLCVGAIDFVASSLGSFSKVSTKVTDYALPALTTVVGITHIGLMSKLVDVDRNQPAKYEPSVNGRRRAGWMFDTLPAITKALTYKEVNQSTYNIPLIIHSTLFVTLGHMGEAIVYWVRAGQDINGADFDL